MSKKTSFFLYLMLSLRQPTAPVTCAHHVAPLKATQVAPLHPSQLALHTSKAKEQVQNSS